MSSRVEKKHATLVAWYRDLSGHVYFLVGTETTYDDYIPLPVASAGKSVEDAIRDVIKDDPKVRFTIRTHGKTGTKSYTLQTAGRTRGFPKGGAKAEDKDDPKNTAIREFEEEVGYALPSGRVQKKGKIDKSYAYTFEVTPREKEEIEASIRRMEAEKKGELVDVRFEKAEDIAKDLHKFNDISRKIFEALRNMPTFRDQSPKPPKEGGSRKNQKRKTRKRRAVKG